MAQIQTQRKNQLLSGQFEQLFKNTEVHQQGETLEVSEEFDKQIASGIDEFHPLRPK